MHFVSLFFNFIAICNLFTTGFNFNVMNALKRVSSPATMKDEKILSHSNVPDMKLVPKSIQVLSVAAIMLSSTLFALPENVNAAQLTASQLFAKSEQAIGVTQKSYGTLFKEWDDTKRSLLDSAKPLAKVINIYKK
jgi:hypothetical protein